MVKDGTLIMASRREFMLLRSWNHKAAASYLLASCYYIVAMASNLQPSSDGLLNQIETDRL